MKTNRFIIAALFIAAAVSCQKENFAGSENPRETETATIVAGEKTRTSLQGDDIHWSSDDSIAVFDNFGHKNIFNITEAEDSYASFNGEVTSGTTQIYAVYPASLAESVSGSSIQVNIPVDQTSKVGSFAEEHNISVANGEKTPGVTTIQDVVFKNVLSYLKFTIPSYIEDVKRVTFSTSRTIAGAATIDAGAETPVAVTGEDGSKSVTMTGSYPAGSQFMFVLSAGEINGFTVTVETETTTWNIIKEASFILEAGRYKTLGMLKLEEVTATANAEHTYDGGTLTGTDVRIDVNIPSSINIYDQVVSMSLSVRNANGTEVRNITKESDFTATTLGANTSWPYLPSGEYTVLGTYTLASGAAKNFTTTFTSGKPSGYTVNAPSPYTSYDVYSKEGKDAANGCGPLTIYNVRSASVNISSEILNNSNYASINKGFEYTLRSNGSSSIVTIIGATAETNALGINTVTAVYVFDGVTQKNEKSCHVTGIPYTLNIAANDAVSPWSWDSGTLNLNMYVNWNTENSVRLGYYQPRGEAYIIKTFSLPTDTKVMCSASGTVNGTQGILGTAKVSNTVTVYVSGYDIHSTTVKGSTPGDFYCGNVQKQMLAANPTVKVNSSYNLEKACVRLKSLTLKYGDK